jgi:hypothetical protein
MVAQRLIDIKKTNTIELTVADTATVSDWVLLPSSVLKVVGFKTPSNCPNTTCVFDVRERSVTGTVYRLKADTDDAADFTLNVNSLSAYGSRAMTPISSFVDGFHEVRLTLGSAISGDGAFILNIPSTTTE